MIDNSIQRSLFVEENIGVSVQKRRNKNYYNKISYSHSMIIVALISCLILGMFILYDYNNQFRFSVKSGFYDNSFNLEILGSKHYDVYYTLDCSTPTKKSNKYEGPIHIKDRTSEPNEYAQRDDVSTGLLTDLVELYALDENFSDNVVPQHNVDKCTVVRAVRYDNNGKKVDEISASYFVGPNIKEKYNNLTVISIATNPDNLFDYNDGIYVNGVDFDNYCETFDEPSHGSQWWEVWWKFWPANYRRSGMESERDVRVDVLGSDESILLSQTCGMRVHGNGSRAKLPRSLKLISREQYSGSRYFPCDLLENGIDAHKYLLFGGADDNICKLIDYLANSMESELNFATMDFKPCFLFLEGEYWGTYYITDIYDKDYIEMNYKVPRDNVVIWKEGEISEGNEEDLDLYTEMVSFINGNDMSVDANYKKACEMIDINSYADYFAAQVFRARIGDWPGGNIGAWRSRSINPNSKYQDGKWRWMLYDVNSEEKYPYTDVLENDTIENIINNETTMFGSLIQNEEFRHLFCDRLLYIENNIYTEEDVNRFIDDYYEQMLEPLCLSSERFNEDDKRDEIIQNAESMRTFLLNRHIYIDKLIVKHFGKEYLEQ